MTPETAQGANAPAVDPPAQNETITSESSPIPPARPNGATMPESSAAQPTADAGSATSSAPTPSLPPAPILCLGIAKTGTASLCAALRAIGIQKVHHGLETSVDHSFNEMWSILDRAADATFPNLPTYRGTPFTREEWDEVWGEYDAITDVASFYGPALIRAYPEAKVILVERDIEAWMKSARVVFKDVSSPWHHKLVRAVELRTGSTAGMACIKFRMGWTGATEPRDCLKNMRASYIRHYKEIREMVPEGQLLEYKLSDGWAPLCEFLGKEVPSEEFPHVNDKAAFKQHVKKVRDLEMKKLAKSFF